MPHCSAPTPRRSWFARARHDCIFRYRAFATTTRSTGRRTNRQCECTCSFVHEATKYNKDSSNKMLNACFTGEPHSFHSMLCADQGPVPDIDCSALPSRHTSFTWTDPESLPSCTPSAGAVRRRFPTFRLRRRRRHSSGFPIIAAPCWRRAERARGPDGPTRSGRGAAHWDAPSIAEICGPARLSQ